MLILSNIGVQVELMCNESALLLFLEWTRHNKRGVENIIESFEKTEEY